MVCAIVLAAGESRRMGTPKPLLPFGRHCVIEQVVRSLQRCPIDRVLVVLGHRHEAIEPVVRPLDVQVVLHPEYRRGMLSSVQAGIAAAPAEATWLFIHPVDHPHVLPEVVAAQLAAGQEGRGTIVVPTHGGRRGHPLLIHARYRDEIATLDPQIGLRELLRRHPDAIHHLAVETDAILRDLDTPADYEREAPSSE